MNSTIFISKYEVQIYAIFRFVAGFLFLWHGSQKLIAFPPAGHEMSAYIVFIAARGSGVYSVDHFLKKRKKNPGSQYL